MAHDIAKIDGIDAMFCVGERDAAWHLLGQRTKDAATWQDACRLAGLNWPVVLNKMYTRVPKGSQVKEGTVWEVPEQMAVWRMSQQPAILGTVGSDYGVIQNSEAFDFVDTLLQAHDGAHYESAGALGKGERIWVMARVPGADIHITGTKDVSRSYLLVAMGHAGIMSFIAKLCTERVVCANTLAVALGQAGTICRIRHTSQASGRLAEAKQIAPSIIRDAKMLETKLNLLARRRMTKDTMVNVLNRLFPENKETARQGKRDALLTKVLELFERNDGDAIPEIRGSAYNLLNAVTEYTDHFRPVRMTGSVQGMTQGQVRAQGAVFGTGDELKTRALICLLEETESCPEMSARVPDLRGDDWTKALGISNL